MSRFQVVGLVVLGLVYLLAKTTDTEGAKPNETTQAVAGLLSGLSESDVAESWRLDSIRKQGLASVRARYPAGSFTAPEWMTEELRGLGSDPRVSDVRDAFRAISERLYPDQNGEHYEFGKGLVVAPRPPPGPSPGKCDVCDGTGIVGDGVIETECLECGGDGIIDDSDRKEGACDSQSPTKESAGDQVSRSPGSVKPVSGSPRTITNRKFPILRRLLGR